jgi:meso-butanediol dehydrogenase/(S,S)-butanediol dehydrogenase/diacetyl reductase
MAGRLDGKVAVITGASSGIGRATLELFASEGALVVGAARTQSNLDAALAAVKELGGEGIAVAADLSRDEDAAEVVAAAERTFGGVDILVNCAGVGYSYKSRKPHSMEGLADQPLEDWNDVMGINLGSMVHTTRHAIAAMRKRGGGSIVNVASILGIVGNPDAHAYTAAKGAMINLTRSCAITYGKDNVRSNVVAPGYTETEMVEEFIEFLNSEEQRYLWNPMGRMGKAHEMAYACLYFASDESSYCNGSVLTVDGGQLCKP